MFSNSEKPLYKAFPPTLNEIWHESASEFDTYVQQLKKESTYSLAKNSVVVKEFSSEWHH